MERPKAKSGAHQLVQVPPDRSPPCPSAHRSATASRSSTWLVRRKVTHSTVSALAVLSLSYIGPHLSKHHLLALVPAQLLALAVGAAASERQAGRTPSVGAVVQGQRWRGSMLLYGASLAAGGLAAVWAARGLHPVIWTGVEVGLRPECARGRSSGR